MGEYAYKNGQCVKIATCEEAFWSRSELLKAQAEGWGAREPGAFDELAELLKDSATVYALPLPFERPFTMEGLKVPTRGVLFTAPLDLACRIEHREVVSSCGGRLKRNYYVPCAYTPEGMKFTKHQNCASRFELFAVGERYRNGAARTIFECAICEASFSLPQSDLRSLDPGPCFTSSGERRLILYPRVEEVAATFPIR